LEHFEKSKQNKTRCPEEYT